MYLSKDRLIRQLTKTKEWLDNGNYKPKESCATPFRIIQKKSTLFANCHEIRFFVVGGVLRGLSTLTQTIFGPTSYFSLHQNKLVDLNGKKLNQKIYNFVMEIANRCNRLWNDNFFYRIDIITECEAYDKLIDNLIDEKWASNIYMNEIENIGSGLKIDAVMLDDNGKEAIFATDTNNSKHNLYDYIAKEIIKIK